MRVPGSGASSRRPFLSTITLALELIAAGICLHGALAYFGIGAHDLAKLIAFLAIPPVCSVIAIVARRTDDEEAVVAGAITGGLTAGILAGLLMVDWLVTSLSSCPYGSACEPSTSAHLSGQTHSLATSATFFVVAAIASGIAAASKS